MVLCVDGESVFRTGSASWCVDGGLGPDVRDASVGIYVRLSVGMAWVCDGREGVEQDKIWYMITLFRRAGWCAPGQKSGCSDVETSRAVGMFGAETR